MISTYFLVIVCGGLVAFLVFPHTVMGEVGTIIELSLTSLTVLAFTFTACGDPGIVFKKVYTLPPLITDDVATGAVSPDLEKGEFFFNPPLTNGTPKRGLRPATAIPKLMYCGQCKLDRPAMASHCYDCDLCILDLDHHCPWTGKCIGRKTIQYFYGFLGALTGLLLWTAVGVIMMTFRNKSESPF